MQEKLLKLIEIYETIAAVEQFVPSQVLDPEDEHQYIRTLRKVDRYIVGHLSQPPTTTTKLQSFDAFRKEDDEAHSLEEQI